jgi:AMP-polyphosphate phosphotransferase
VLLMRLRDVDLEAHFDRAEYKRRRDRNHKQLVTLQQRLYRANVPVVIVFEGWDASGKGGAISRLLKHIDPRGYHLYAIGAPTQEELEHHYLRRFWLRLPSKGRIALFDRSWYGRVMVERVEGYATAAEWRRAYDEINHFEQLLTDDGCLVIKFFLHISREEQEQRFAARADNPLKSWKLTPEDYRNRGKWSEYEKATDEMLAKTDKPNARWYVIAANDKRHARITVQDIVIEAFRRGLQQRRPGSAGRES